MKMQQGLPGGGVAAIPAAVDAVAKQIVDAAYNAHRLLGPGLLESVYEACLAHELAKRKVRFERQVNVPIVYDGLKLQSGLRLDLLVDGCVVVEVKAVEQLTNLHVAQMLTYLRLSGHRLGFLINFNVTNIGVGTQRIAL
jgi:GxxExxY protein